MAKATTRTTRPKPEPALTTEIATTRDGRDITQPWVQGLRQAKDPKLSTAVDWGAYDVVFNDDQVKSTMQQRIGAVVSRDWNVLAGDEEDPRSVAAAEAFNRTMKRLPWDRITRMMLMASFYGYAVAELMWGVRDGLFDIVGIKVRHARRFRYDDEDRLRMLTPNTPQGELLPERKFWVHAVGAADDDQPYGMGLAHWLYWPTLFKRNGIRFWNIFLDKYGTPTAKGTYPRGSSTSDVNKLLMALQAIATDSGFVIPEGMAVELLSAAKSGTADFHQLCLYMDAAISKIVLSQTMTTDNGSSRSQGEVHADVKLEVVKTDADDLTDSFTASAARWWTDYNFGTDVAAPIVRRIVEEEEDTAQTADTDAKHASNGWVRTVDSFRDTYGEGFVRKGDPDAPSGFQPAAAGQIGHNGGPALNDNGLNDLPATDTSGKSLRPKPASFAADDPRPLYVSRQLLNASEVLDWARAQGFATTLPASDLHVTVMYSRRPVNWFGMGQWGSNTGELIVAPGGPRLVERLGEDGAVVLMFQSGDLQWRHREMRDAGASWDHPSYLPHITLTYDAGDLDLAKVEPYQGRLIFGPERFEAIQSDWHDGVPEVPASFAAPDPQDTPHDDADSIVDRMIAEDGWRVANAMTGSLVDRIMAADSEIAARAILAGALGTMDEQPLFQALERAGFAAQLDAAIQTGETDG